MAGDYLPRSLEALGLLSFVVFVPLGPVEERASQRLTPHRKGGDSFHRSPTDKPRVIPQPLGSDVRPQSAAVATNPAGEKNKPPGPERKELHGK